MKSSRKFIWTPLIGLAGLLGIYILFTLGRPTPVPVQREVYDGVAYRRIVHQLPHSMIVHVLVIDKKSAEIKFLVTPAGPSGDGSVPARTTSQFLDEFGLQIAINGDGFFPWWSRSPADYYPHEGEPVTPKGYAASFGDIYADGEQDDKPEPTLYISKRNDLTFNRKPGKIHHAISGDTMLILGGEIAPDLDDEVVHPRTAIGINRNGRYTYLVVVDGRQPFYSTGATYQELAEILKDLGAFWGMALDGGGSSTIVIEGENGEPLILNSPIDSYIPGRERPVANHLGIYIDQ